MPTLPALGLVAAASSRTGLPAPVPVRLAGAAARLALAEGAQGRVLAVFRRSFYVETEPGQVACLGPPGLGAGPLNALCDLPPDGDWQASGLAPGRPVRVSGATLHVGPALRFALGEVAGWMPRVGAPATRDGVAAGLAALPGAWRTVPPRGWGRLLAPPAGAGRDGVARAAAAAAAAGATELTGWLRNGSPQAPPVALATLLGLGTGLTPAGDDFLGGVLIALRRLGARARADALAALLLPLAPGRTPRISAAHLACAARGQGAGALHEALEAVCGAEVDGLAGALRAVDAIGHTSGWDALAGALTAAAAWTSAAEGAGAAC